MIIEKGSFRSSVLRSLWNRWLGNRGERAAARYLQREGWKILARGYRTAQGEVDLICRDGNVVVFVEVKTRKAGHPAEAVDHHKQRKLTLASVHFLRRHGLLDHAARFDVVAILWSDGKSTESIEHIPNAFEAVGRGQLFY